MQKYLRAYAPSLGELWFILLVLVCIGGSLAGGAVALLAQFIFQLDPDSMLTISIAAYPITFVFAVPFVFYRAKESYRRHTHTKSNHGLSDDSVLYCKYKF